MKIAVLVLMGLAGGLAWAGEKENPPLETVPSVDLAKYMGTWYEIAAFPQRFERGCHCATAEYAMTDKGTVRVINACRKGGPDGKPAASKGKAFVVKNSGNAKLRVQFFWPFRGDYWIIDLAPDYGYAVVGAPNRKYLWILSRTPVMDEALYGEIVTRCAAKGFDPARLRRMDQSCAGR
jgi:apolipoprotein D and lipocalin family protein